MRRSAVRFTLIQVVATAAVAWAAYSLLTYFGVPSYRDDPSMRGCALPLWLDALCAGLFGALITLGMYRVDTIYERTFGRIATRDAVTKYFYAILGSAVGGFSFWSSGGVIGIGGTILFAFAGTVTLLVLQIAMAPFRPLIRWFNRRFGLVKEEDHAS